MVVHDPAHLAIADQVTADASRFIDQILTRMLPQLENGVPHANIVMRIGGSLFRHELIPEQMGTVAAVAVARLARLHHAIEQLADELKCDNDVGRWPALPAALIKLVDDHG